MLTALIRGGSLRYLTCTKNPTQKPCKLTYKMVVKACYYLSNERIECPLKGWVRSSTGLVVKG